MTPISRSSRPDRSSAWNVAGVLFLLSPVLLPALVVIALTVLFLVLIVVQAFGAGFAEGCAALGAVIALPSLGLLWLSAAMRVLGRRPIVPGRPAQRPLSGLAEMEARYRSGDFIHRDYEAEERARREG